MTIYAVMKTGGKEYRVAPGDVVRVEKLAAAPGATVEIDEVCLIAIGQDVTVGSPTVAGARVVAEVIEEGRGEKIVTFKKKRGNRYQMSLGELQSYTVLRIRAIALGNTVYAAGAPPGNVDATLIPPASPPEISKAERRLPEPQAKKPKQPHASAPLAPIALPPAAAADSDAPAAPKVAGEEPVGAQPQAAEPSSDAAHRVHAVQTEPAAARVTPFPRVETAAPTMALDERGSRKPSYRMAALVVVAVLVMAAGFQFWGARQPRVPAEPATVAASPPEARASVPQPVQSPPRKETAIKNPFAASAPSAPVQPPE